MGMTGSRRRRPGRTHLCHGRHGLYGGDHHAAPAVHHLRPLRKAVRHHGRRVELAVVGLAGLRPRPRPPEVPPLGVRALRYLSSRPDPIHTHTHTHPNSKSAELCVAVFSWWRPTGPCPVHLQLRFPTASWATTWRAPATSSAPHPLSALPAHRLGVCPNARQRCTPPGGSTGRTLTQPKPNPTAAIASQPPWPLGAVTSRDPWSSNATGWRGHQPMAEGGRGACALALGAPPAGCGSRPCTRGPSGSVAPLCPRASPPPAQRPHPCHCRLASNPTHAVVQP